MQTKTKRSIQWIQENKGSISKKQHQYAGLHLFAEFWGGEIIEDVEKMKAVLSEAVRRADNTPLDMIVHKFDPQGMTGIILLAESHISVHTWPEFSYAALDIYTCGDKSNPEKALEYLKEVFSPKTFEIRKIKRGKRPEFLN